MRRCAVYTRKSSDEGLDQQFNSLDAQREACEAYILSQAGEGWTAFSNRYDDGGYSGGSMERPALRRLLDDIGKGQVDVVVVYKIDRLTRSLADFARIVEQFDAREVSFVSVTQAFNTTSSMGRLTLNVLLSFAQFEREVTGERIRDKIAASKAKGMWMGGLPPLGYDLPAGSDRVLRANEAEAETVRWIFERYLELGSVHALVADMAGRGIVSKVRTRPDGTRFGGLPVSRGATFHLLRNRIYIGEIVHKGEVHPGLHEPIIPRDLFDRVQQLLDRHRRQRIGRRRCTAPLAGRLFLDDGSRLTPTHSRGANGKVHRYYVPLACQTGNGQSGPRLPAARLEAQLRTVLGRIATNHGDPLDLPIRVELHPHQIALHMPVSMRSSISKVVAADEMVELLDGGHLCWSIPWSLPRRGCELLGRCSSSRRDPVLIRALRTAHAMLDHDRSGRPYLSRVPGPRYQRRLARLAFLSPRIQAAIIEGRQPAALTLEYLVRHKLPIAWHEQERFVARLAGSAAPVI
jgi:DNA invertase Pin-like site-specific DNA recombinase